MCRWGPFISSSRRRTPSCTCPAPGKPRSSAGGCAGGARRTDERDLGEAPLGIGAPAMRSEARAAILFVAPALAVLGIFFFLPVIAGFALSLTDFDLYAIGDIHNARFIALRNYGEVLANGVFWTALVNTLYFSLVGGPLTVAVSLGAALLVNARAARLKPLFRTIYFAPVVTTLVAVAVVFRFLYNPKFGIFNPVLANFGLPPVAWLGDPRWAMPAIIALAVWKNFGYNMIIFIAGLQ